MDPGHVRLGYNALLARADELWRLMSRCHLCPRECGARRREGERGVCGASAELEIASWGAHFGEENGLVGQRGSGTVFFRHCSLRCLFCQNADISQGAPGLPCDVDDLADILLRLQRRGCHNLNFVTPTHYAPLIILAVARAGRRGLRLPVVWNTSGWERLDVLRRLEDAVDVYLADLKFAESRPAARWTGGVASYPSEACAAVLEMHRQVGVARPEPDGVIRRGLMIRHLVIPGQLRATRLIVQWIAENLPRDTFVNLMAQYRPCHRASDMEGIDRGLTPDEWQQAVTAARDAGLAAADVTSGRRWIMRLMA